MPSSPTFDPPNNRPLEEEKEPSPIRRDRLSRGLRLADVAAGTGFSISFLSLLERGLRDATPDERKRLREFYREARVR